MFRSNLKFWIAALAVGMAFEAAKRWQWPATDASLSPDFVAGAAGVPYAAHLGHDASPSRPSRHRRYPHKKIDPTASLTKALMIPPKSGAFDSNAGIVANAAKGKAVSQDHKGQTAQNEKKCRPRPQDPALAQQNAQNAQVIPPVLIPQEALLSGQSSPEKSEDLSNEQKEAAERRKKSAESLGLSDEKKNAAIAQKEADLPFCEEEKPSTTRNDEQKGTPDHDEDANTAHSRTPVLTTTQNPTSPTTTGAATTNPTLENWKRRLLSEPSLAETIKLIEAMQMGQINPADFYLLVDLMMKDNREAMKELAVLAAGRTPSYQSFHVLTSLLKREPYGTQLRKKAEAELNYYEQPQFLSILGEVLRSSEDVFALVWATRQLDDSAHKYLTTKYNRPNPKNPSQMINPYVGIYNRFILVLQELVATSGAAGEQTIQAKQTLYTIQNLIRALG